MKQRILHLSTLVEKGACTKRVNLFRELFGESVTVTEKKAVSVAGRFDWNWAADKLLSQSALDEYCRAKRIALDEYFRTKQNALDEFKKTKQTALDEYFRTKQNALDEFKKTKQTALDEYKKIEQASLDRYWKRDEVAIKEYWKNLAETFANLYINDKPER